VSRVKRGCCVKNTMSFLTSTGFGVGLLVGAGVMYITLYYSDKLKPGEKTGEEEKKPAANGGVTETKATTATLAARVMSSFGNFV